MQNKVNELKGVLPKLSAGDQKFANDLISGPWGYERRGKLSTSQLVWVDKLIARATAPKPVQQTIKVGSMSGVIALFAKAQEKLKHPKITLSLNGAPVVLSVAGQGSKAPGSINVMGEGKYPNREWFGRISPEGDWAPSGLLQKDQARLESLLILLGEFAYAPAEVARKYGALTGNCCFCAKKLTDDKSVAAGFGPKCAENFGLKAEWKAAVDKHALYQEPAPAQPVLPQLAPLAPTAAILATLLFSM